MTGTFPLLSALAAWLLTYLVHSTLLLGAAALLSGRLVRGEEWKETLWKAALVGGLLTATVQAASGYRLSGGQLELPTLTAASAEPRTLPGVGPASAAPELRETSPDGGSPVPDPSPAPIGAPSPAEARAASTPAPGSRRGGWPLLLVAVWGGVALALLARLALRQARLHRLLRDRRQVEEGGLPSMLAELRRNAGIWHQVWLTASPRCPSPLALGTREVCVPERFITELDPEQQRAALAHELAHLARRDPVWHLVAGVVESVCFFQPLNRLARLRLRESAEYLCDDWAVRQTGLRLGLARCLAEVAAWVAPGRDPIPSGTLAMAEGGSPLLLRVQRLLDGRGEDAARSPLLRGLLAAGLLAAVVTAAPAITPPDGRLSAAASEGADDLPPESGAQSGEVRVVRAPDPSLPLAARWSWAEAAAARAGDRVYWIAYPVPSLVPAGEAVISDSGAWSLDELDRAPLGRTLGIPAAGEGGRSPVVLLFRMRDPRSGPVRMERVGLRSPSVGMRLDAPVYLLGPATPAESFALLRDRYRSLPETERRGTLLEAISVHPAPGVAGYLTRLVEDGRDADVRRAAVEGLKWHATDEGLALLARVARADGSAEVRRQAVESIGGMDHPRAGAVLREILDSGSAPEVRRQAVEALGERAGPGLVELLFEIAMRDPDDRLRREATESLENAPPAEAVPLLRRIAWENDRRVIQRQAAESLGNPGTAEALAALDELVARHPHPEVVRQAVESIAGFPARLAAPRLERIARGHPMAEARDEALDRIADATDSDSDSDVDVPEGPDGSPPLT